MFAKLLLVCAILVSFCYLSHCKGDIIRGTGSFSINAIFPLKPSPSKVDFQNGVILAEAMRYAIQKVNSLDYLHGYKLKIEDIHNCNTETTVREKVLDSYLKPVQFLIGPFSSETSYFASILTDTFFLPSISYSATYSDFGRFGVMQRYMFRTVPSDEYRILAALNFIQQAKWTYVGVINSHGYDGERDAVSFIQKLSEYGACLSSQHNLPKFKTDNSTYSNAVDQMASDKRLKAIVLFTSNPDSRNILKVLKMKGLYGRFQIFCAYGCTNYVNVVEDQEDIANGTLSLYIHNHEIKEFKDYFLKLKPSNHPYSKLYFSTFWENIFQCYLNNSSKKLYTNKCTENETLSDNHGYYPMTPVHTVLDAVYGIAHSVRGFIEKICNKEFYAKRGLKSSKCIVDPVEIHRITDHVVEELNKIIYKDGTLIITKPGYIDFNSSAKEALVRYDINRFEYNESNSKINLVWSWQVDRYINTTAAHVEENKLFKTFWFTSQAALESVGICSLPCGIGYYMDHDKNYFKAKCCWTCRACPKNSIVINNTCVTCDRTEKPSEDRATCLDLQVRDINWGSNIISVIFILFSVVGLALTSTVAFIFCKHNSNRIVRASGRDLCYTIMAGICLTFACPFVFLTQPNKVSCILRGALPGFSFLACYAPLFLKTNRIYRIFFSARVSVSRPSLVSSQSQFAAMFGILALQVIVSIVWFSSQIPVPETVVSKDSLYVTVHCSSDSNPVLLLLNLSLSVLFMICCTVLAFKTRHFPKNYNEAKYIGITLYITCVVWALFLPIFFLIKYVDTDFMKEYLMCIVCILIGFITLFGMFGPKILMVYHAPPSSEPGSIPTWYVANSKDHDNDRDQENTAMTEMT